MAIQLSVAVRNARLNAIETTISTSPKLLIYELNDAAPANCAAEMAAEDTVLATLTLPEDWMAAADAGAKALSGTWSDAAADASGTAEFFRIYNNGLTTCHLQGTVSATGMGGDLTLDTDAINEGQTITITTFTLTDGNA